MFISQHYFWAKRKKALSICFSLPQKNLEPERERQRDRAKVVSLIYYKELKMKEMQAIETTQPTTVAAPAVHSRQLGAQLSGSMSFSSQMSKEDEEMSRTALSAFRAKEEEIEKKKMEIRERVQAQLGRVEEETKRLALIREELEGLADPMRKEVALVRKKIDSVNKELKPLGHTVQKKEREYKEALEAFNEKNREKVQLITKLMELVGESEKVRMKKLEELSKNIDSIH